MKQIDYYSLLEVNKKSSNEEIKTNFRRLAKAYHPDANIDDPNAEEKFKQLNTAYSTLTDKEKRKKYDKQTARFGYGVVKVEKAKRLNEKNQIVNEFFSTILGLGKDAREKVAIKTEDFKNKIDEMKEPKKGDNIDANLEITMEEGFLGAEKKLALKTAGGKTNNYSVNVPRGIHDGEKVRLAALGKPGKNGGKPGDLIITVKMKTHPLFVIEGADVHANLFITHTQSVIGDTVYLKLFGEQIEITIPEKTRNKDVLVINKKGYALGENDRGNLIVTLNIQPTGELNERERKIYEQLLKVEKQKQREKTIKSK
ncbi:MAG: J domain-containing protein [Clostridia bacterium]|nr:J domain-containing protein [Clostridia bacterium]